MVFKVRSSFSGMLPASFLQSVYKFWFLHQIWFAILVTPIWTCWERVWFCGVKCLHSYFQFDRELCLNKNHLFFSLVVFCWHEEIWLRFFTVFRINIGFISHIDFSSGSGNSLMKCAAITIQELDCIGSLSLFCKMCAHIFLWLWAFQPV